MVCRKELTYSKPEIAILRNSCLQGLPLVGMWEIPTIPKLKNGLLCLNCTNNVVYADHLHSFWESGILVPCLAESAYMTCSQ